MILCGLAGFFEEYVPVFLLAKNVMGAKKIEQQKLYAGMVGAAVDILMVGIPEKNSRRVKSGTAV